MEIGFRHTHTHFFIFLFSYTPYTAHVVDSDVDVLFATAAPVFMTTHTAEEELCGARVRKNCGQARAPRCSSSMTASTKKGHFSRPNFHLECEGGGKGGKREISRRMARQESVYVCGGG